jgi:hypothetical protein
LYDEVAPLGDSDAAFELENRRAREWAAARAAERAAAQASTSERS